MNDPPPTLESLAFDWADAYLISYTRDRWVALRRDTRYFLAADTPVGLEADTPVGLEQAIISDYSQHPVLREFDPPGASDYLSAPGPDEDVARDDDDGLDAETLIILGELRRAFPVWTITCSEQMRAWVARTRKKTICEDSAVRLCVALGLSSLRCN